MNPPPIRKVEVVPPNPAWAEEFAVEAARLSAIVGLGIVRVHHFGSTVIPGICAKPVIDILIEVAEIHAVDTHESQLIQLGYFAKGEFGIAGRRFFGKGTETHRTHHVHFYQSGHPEIARHLDFRDYMMAHPDEAARYAELKLELAQKYAADIDGYNTGKTAFIQEMDRRARRWKEETS